MELEQFIKDNFIWIVLATIWTFAWKGVALWRAAQQEQKNWFIAMLVLNTLGILEITYLFYFSKKNDPNLET